MLAVDSNRTRLYLLQMARAQVLPAHVLLLTAATVATHEQRASAIVRTPIPDDAGDDVRHFLSEPVPALLDQLRVPFRQVGTLDPNADVVVSAVGDRSERVIVYSGPGGAILKRPLLATGRRFLHVHPGILPAFRGSTTVYYSLLEEGNCGATALFLDEHIDTGPVVRTRRFAPPADRTTIDLFYDPWMRSVLLAEVLQTYASTGAFPEERQPADGGETYFVIHPVLKHIAILGPSREDPCAAS